MTLTQLNNEPRFAPLTRAPLISGLQALGAVLPLLRYSARNSGSLLRNLFKAPGQSQSIKVWAPLDLRLQQSLFHANVPTFILSNDQRFLDWNIAFDLIFGGSDSLAQVHRGGKVQKWYAKLDNYRRVPKRSEQLYGEAILPITDRERVTFLSSKYGRMVFTRIMSPVVDRSSGRIIGWTVVLNINSVNRRQEFFSDLYAAIAKETKMIRHAAGVDGVLGRFPGRQNLNYKVCEQFSSPGRILEISCGTGAITSILAVEGHKVVAMDNDVHQLRIARERCRHTKRVRFVRSSLSRVGRLPTGKFDGVVFNALLSGSHDISKALPEIYRSLVDGGTLVLVMRADNGSIEALFDAVKVSLELQARFENLKHQFSQVADHQSNLGAQLEIGEELREAIVFEKLKGCGFAVDGVDRDADDGQTIVVKARK